jgi:hydroxyethylthiazole kinase
LEPALFFSDTKGVIIKNGVFGECLEQRAGFGHPLIHNITNYVTVNDVANVLLACGGQPHNGRLSRRGGGDPAICGGLNINIGTLNTATIPAMLLAGKKADALGHPPCSTRWAPAPAALRTDTALKLLLDQVRFTVVRGNISEIKTLAAGFGTTKGVDADVRRQP